MSKIPARSLLLLSSYSEQKKVTRNERIVKSLLPFNSGSPMLLELPRSLSDHNVNESQGVKLHHSSKHWIVPCNSVRRE
ncbi:unnamed protein product [Cylicocyclus nassatus]|uniref:Uncharacterized protein n=1 Tax=Cylicocyclus nassatus TaxID=53992 RepID=A0AA36MFS6_CYLNA|nr:unnamed protein product [Cylicocyclus nassatus]